MLVFKRRLFKHMSGASATDQRAFLEAALMTISIDGHHELTENVALRRMTSRIRWKIDVQVEIGRIAAEIGNAIQDSERMFSFIDRIRDRTASPETRTIILDLRHEPGNHGNVNSSFEASFLTHLQQKLAF